MKPAWCCLTIAALATPVAAQDVRPDSARALAPVVVVAERSATALNWSTAAVTRISGTEIARLPHATVADVLRQVPGFAVIDFDGLGRDPQVMARGFYGGGEAEYVVVLVDGRPVNRAHNGTVAWDALPPLSAIDAIEIVRGSASAVHGDAAVGGVINIVTRRTTPSSTRWSLAGASYNSGAVGADLAGLLGSRPATVNASVDRTKGFRDHSSRSTIGARGALELTEALRLNLYGTWRDFDEPGPLLEDQAATDRSQSDPMFAADNTTDRSAGVQVEHRLPLARQGTLRSTVSADRRRLHAVRTIALAPGLGDTKGRVLQTGGGAATMQADFAGTALPGDDHVTVGASIESSSINSRYYTLEGGVNLSDAAGDGGRSTAALFAHLSSAPVPWLRWTLGLRADWLRDSFTPEDADRSTASHAAVSPKAGVNIRYANSPRAAGHVFVSASRSFKAPTLDQLFDQRSIPIPFPPFSLTSSNPDLDPQRGTGIEAGVYHDVIGKSIRFNANLSVYQIAMRDEIDFDLQTFTYLNIARSRHRGLEAGFSVGGHLASAFVTLTVQDVVARAGDNAGKQLKAIPGQALSAGLTVSPHHGGTVTLSATRMADMYIDDANTRRLDAWSRVDAQVSHELGQVNVVVGLRNLLGARYHSSGFLDPSGSGMAYFYPAAARVLTIGVRHGW